MQASAAVKEVRDTVLAVVDLPLWLVFGAFAAVGAIVFMPADVAALLRIGTFREHFGGEIGIAFVGLSAWLLAKLVVTAVTPVRRRMLLREHHRRLHTLTAAEKGYLACFIVDGETTILAPMDDGVAGGLMARKIIFRSSAIFDLTEGVSYNLQPWAREYLSAHRELLDDAGPGPISARERLFGRRSRI